MNGVEKSILSLTLFVNFYIINQKQFCTSFGTITKPNVSKSGALQLYINCRDNTLSPLSSKT